MIEMTAAARECALRIMDRIKMCSLARMPILSDDILREVEATLKAFLSAQPCEESKPRSAGWTIEPTTDEFALRIGAAWCVTGDGLCRHFGTKEAAIQHCLDMDVAYVLHDATAAKDVAQHGNLPGAATIAEVMAKLDEYTPAPTVASVCSDGPRSWMITRSEGQKRNSCVWFQDASLKPVGFDDARDQYILADGTRLNSADLFAAKSHAD